MLAGNYMAPGRHLQRQAGARGHGVAVAGAGVRGGGAEVRAPVPARGQDRVGRPEAVQAAVLHAQRDHPAAGALLVHDQVQRKVLHCTPETGRNQVRLGVATLGVCHQGFLPPDSQMMRPT